MIIFLTDANCDDGWLSFGTSCYLFVLGDDKDRDDAQYACMEWVSTVHRTSDVSQTLYCDSHSVKFTYKYY